MGSFRPASIAGLVCLLIALTLSLSGWGARRASVEGPTILKFSEASLATYLPSTGTSIGGVRPLAAQRAVNVDGSGRGQSSLPIAIAGNPFESSWSGQSSLGGVRLDTGTYSPYEVDIALPTTGFAVVVARTYSARQEDAGDTHIDSNGPMGVDWALCALPEIQFYDDEVDSADAVYLVLGADRYATYLRTGSEAQEFRGVNGAAGCFVFHEGGESVPDTWTLTDLHGTEVTFFGFDADASYSSGQWWRTVSASGAAAFVGHASDPAEAISTGVWGHGYSQYIFDPDDRRFSLAYSEINGSVRLTQVKVETKSGGTWEDPTDPTVIAQVDYSFYGDEAHGDVGDLKLVSVSRFLSDGTTTVPRKSLYRYWEGSYHVSTNPGYPHALKYVYSAEGLRQFDLLDASFDEDFADPAVSDATLEPFASSYHEYDASHRVRKLWTDGGCGCGGGAGDGLHTLTYSAVSYTDDAGYDEEPASRTVVERPDGSFLTCPPPRNA